MKLTPLARTLLFSVLTVLALCAVGAVGFMAIFGQSSEPKPGAIVLPADSTASSTPLQPVESLGTDPGIAQCLRWKDALAATPYALPGPRMGASDTDFEIENDQWRTSAYGDLVVAGTRYVIVDQGVAQFHVPMKYDFDDQVAAFGKVQQACRAHGVSFEWHPEPGQTAN